MNLGINLCFAVKRWLEPAAWAGFVRQELGLDTVQFTFDLLDPWWPDPERAALIERIRRAADAQGLTIHSACVGLAGYVPGGLLDPDPTARRLAARWWQRAIEVAAALGARAVGGPLGTMSLADALQPDRRNQCYQDLVEAIDTLARRARDDGLTEFLIEPTPIAREIPSSIEQCRQLLCDLGAHATPGVGFILDVGHTVYEPLYGPTASAETWIAQLGGDIRLVHLDNTDRRGDPHWGWPDPRGRVDVASVAQALRDADLHDLPVMLEVYPRFEDDDAQVRALLASSVAHCRAELARTGRTATAP